MIQCEDYIKELTAVTITQTESKNQKICNSENLCTTNQLEVQTQEKLTYIRDLDRSDQFVVTSPDVDIHYQEDVNKRLNIPTLYGKVQLSQKLNTDPVVEWKKDREISPDSFKQGYTPLQKRTKTLSDIKHMDSSSDHKAVDTLIENHQNYEEAKNIWMDAAENGI